MNKKIVLPLLAVLFVAGGVLGAVLIKTINATININESFSSSSVDFVLDGSLGTTVTKEINVNNAASVALPVKVQFVELTNVNNAIYTVNTVSQQLQPGANVVTLSFEISPNSPVGQVTGKVEISRGA